MLLKNGNTVKFIYSFEVNGSNSHHLDPNHLATLRVFVQHVIQPSINRDFTRNLNAPALGLVIILVLCPGKPAPRALGLFRLLRDLEPKNPSTDAIEGSENVASRCSSTNKFMLWLGSQLFFRLVAMPHGCAVFQNRAWWAPVLKQSSRRPRVWVVACGL